MTSDPNNSVGNSEVGEPRSEREGLRLCQSCNSPLAADTAGEFCAVCMLRSAIGDVADTGGERGSLESSAASGFGHYAVELDKGGNAVELGRGAMGLTYKAFDTELQCSVALKVIGERHLVSVAHEALLREWKRVREWLSENRDFLRMRDRLDASLKLWLSRGRQKDDLLRPGLALAEGEKLVADFASSLSEQQAGYIRASIVERARLKAAQDWARYRVMGGITAALIIAVAFGIVSFRQYRRAERAKVATSQAAKRATLARNEAEKLINFMTLDLRDKLKPIGRLDLLAEVSRRIRSYYDAFAGDNDSPEILRATVPPRSLSR
jgi:hypothetical protein